MSTLNVNTVQSSTSNPPIFKNSGGDVAGTLCRAWVNFNGTGTVAIRDSHNVSSITDNGTGNYTLNFTNPMSDTNYCANLSYSNEVDDGGNAHTVGFIHQQNLTNVLVIFYSTQNSNHAGDKSVVNVSVFAN